jgi:ribonuclease-3
VFKARKFKDLERKLGYKFKDERSLECALTHASVRGGKPVRADNERLEFVGDRVLGLAIAGFLNEAFPTAKEGELARRYNGLVRGEACARIGRALDIGSKLVLSEAEATSGGRDKDTILADAVEAILGAIYIEAGFDVARDVVMRLWDSQLVDQKPQMVAADPKTALQEWAQGHGLNLPQYSVVSREGPDHAPMFTAEVKIKSLEPARGEGASKRLAEQAAAASLLEREGVIERGGNG